MAVTLQQIADAAGVSRGTVDRALNNRGRIRPEVAERIRTIADQMGYKPNTGGRALALLKHRRTIGVIEQFAETPFVIEIDEGVRAAADSIDRYGCAVRIHRIDGVDADKVANTIWEMREQGVNGIAVVATDDARIRREIEACAREGIPVVTFNSDLADSARVAFVGQDARKSGRTAAGLMCDMLAAGGKIAILSGARDSSIQNDRIRGFREVIEADDIASVQRDGGDTVPNRRETAEVAPDQGEAVRACIVGQAAREIVSVRYTGETVTGLKQQAEALLTEIPDLAGIYMNAQGKNELCEILKARGMDQRVRLIVHDLVACNHTYIEDGTINYVIDEDSYIQGNESVMTLFRLLYDGQQPEHELNYTDIKIISRYNLL